ncbi:ATP-binding protein [Butyrivibrio sp. CB08]|uniref:ATP-binding protein n=1 Tax=Butyrivibrio sp. CB08 TaxID=2364879 RepID=UPI000EA93279|nr:ATP-binding protein [Butyrivibrio sp. CB08]RKM55437.1 ATP-binding protein [Butyrivibrio sp. CB08]
MLKISKGKVARPLRVVIDGVEGIGKSTFAAQFPDPLFIDLEKGTDSMDVARTQMPETWEELLQITKDVVADPSVCRTLVVDTGDWAEHLCEAYVCRSQHVSGIEDIGYGKGYTYLREAFADFLKALDSVIEAGVNVVICCHTQIKKFELPDEQGAYDRYELKLSKQVSPLVREWCDIQLFANFKTYVVSTENNKNHHKGTGGTKRVMYSSHTASWDAKNRHGLPDEMDFSFKSIAHLFNSKAPRPKSPLEQVHELMTDSGITDEELRDVVVKKGKYPPETPIEEYEPAFLTGWVIKYWKDIVPIVEKNRKDGDSK